MNFYPNFTRAFQALSDQLIKGGQPVHSRYWQALEVEKDPSAEMRELLFASFQTRMLSEDLDHYRRDIGPNLPWADDHFEQERASGEPINPGETWRNWPWGLAADKHRTEGEKFSHSYAERYWPKEAGNGPTGIRYPVGDLGDLVQLLLRDPYTRQAYLPVWFPEDTGAVHRQRVPCTLGYHFMRRGELLHIFYPIRSCDLYRHMRDDWYLTVRLLLWVLDQLQALDPEKWSRVRPGLFQFWAGSLHVFINDLRILEQK